MARLPWSLIWDSTRIRGTMQLSTRNLKLPKGSLSRPAFRFAGTVGTLHVLLVKFGAIMNRTAVLRIGRLAKASCSSF